MGETRLGGVARVDSCVLEEEWCHLCGARRSVEIYAEVVVPTNAENRVMRRRAWVRICRPCINRLVVIVAKEEPALKEVQGRHAKAREMDELRALLKDKEIK